MNVLQLKPRRQQISNLIPIMRFIPIFFLLICSVKAGAQANLDFEQGLTGWVMVGDAGNFAVDKSVSHHASYSVRIGGGAGIIQKRIDVTPLSIIKYDAYIKSGKKGVEGFSFINFYNTQNKLLLSYKSKPTGTMAWQQTGNYTLIPANAEYAEIGVEKDSKRDGYIYADDFSIQNNADIPKTNHPPICNLDQYMEPFWNSDTIYNETVLLYSANGKPAEGKLLFMPSKILSVKNYLLDTLYKAGADYTVCDNTINRTEHSAMPYRADTSFNKKDLDWFNNQAQWAVVTYTHHDKWKGPAPQYKGGHMPRTMAKLKTKSPLKIEAFGMSITRGMDVSGYDELPPFMPNYADLFARQLRKKYHYKNIKLYNAGLPGSVVSWGAQYAEKYVNPLKPDLVILDFGMNDFWSYTPEQFKTYIQTIIKKVKAGNPKVEFLLLSNMKFDPDYMTGSDKYKTWYEGNLEGYSHVLRDLETTGIINLDMYSISSAIYHKKKAKDCLVNPLHPNDYMARWYAQGMAALLTE